MIYSLLITNINGNVLLSKNYNAASDEKQMEYEKSLYQLTKDEWTFAKNERHLVAELTSSATIVVYTNVGELMLFLAGSSETYDELALSDILNPISECLKDVCKKKAVTELLFIEQIPKFVQYLDEIIQRGILDQTQFESISNYSQLKHDKKETV
ncbi:hypothetical protein SAMD00019534_020360 [Acytostelium subglobosum LB1]|uniref:hypothetical protein n=1 Tax=Acytostelium subglobosum LB1 TaxID=1410327 RepID=UPI000645192E|nr:hypothetical protein SAMD00019534_020360 [Acytostelium subglobosum LB1]GAM18861.1 hypothetical protein SAMD00019534_020360 [Acytostelium subglobosum LB1]|eukprot:XP_012758081.1 hypothetical protein SAMD00019534_020360 [Acytostelium subglobosum LB1]